VENSEASIPFDATDGCTELRLRNTYPLRGAAEVEFIRYRHNQPEFLQPHATSICQQHGP
jgi:hypothetical protein